MKNPVELIVSLFPVLIVFSFVATILFMRRFKIRYKGLFVGFLANICELLMSLPLLLLPQDKSIRPMALFSLILAVAIGALIRGLPMAIRETRNKESRLHGAIGIFLCLLPVITGVLVFHLMVFVGGLRLAE